MHDVQIDDERTSSSHLSQQNTIHVSSSKEDFLARAASIDGNDLNESSWNDLNQLLSETVFDLDSAQGFDLLGDLEISSNPQPREVKAKPSSAPSLNLKPPDVTPSKTVTAFPVSPGISNEEVSKRS